MGNKYIKNINEKNRIYSIINTGRRDKTGILYRAADYIVRYPEDDFSEDLKKWIFERIKDVFQNPLFQRALDIPDEYLYTKKVELYKTLPFVSKYNPLRYYLTIFLKLDKKNRNNPIELYKACKDFCDKYFPNQISDSTFEKVINVATYYDLNFYANAEAELSFDEKEALFVGKCGEYIIDNWLNTYIGRTTFVSRDCSTNFGFDILYDDPVWDREVLIEVKSTHHSFEEDKGICISKNERRILTKTASLPKTEYIIIRAYLDEETKETTYMILYYDKERDVFYNNDNPKFIIEYRKTSSKKKSRYIKTLIPKVVLTKTE